MPRGPEMNRQREAVAGRPPLASRSRGVQARLAVPGRRRIAVLCGLIFVPAGLVKFALHHWELHAFRDFGIPASAVMEPLVGALETVGGVLLIGGVLVVPTAFVLAVIMCVAFIAGGIIHGSAIPSDTLAPALLAAMAYVIATSRRTRA